MSKSEDLGQGTQRLPRLCEEWEAGYRSGAVFYSGWCAVAAHERR